MTEPLLTTLPAPADAPEGPLERGTAALTAGRFDEAAALLEEAARLHPPGDPAVELPLAEARVEQRRYAEAQAILAPHLEREPKDVEVRGLMGAALFHRGELSEAIRLLVRTPDRAVFHLASAGALAASGDLDGAERAARRAVAAGPDRADAHAILGTILGDQGRHAEAHAALARALEIDPAFAPARLARARLRLAVGDFRAWHDLDWRLNLTDLAPRFTPPTPVPAWDGSSPAGKTLLLVAEPGLCDQIMFVRYAAVLKRAGARVLLACPPETARLLARADGVDRVVTDPSALAAVGTVDALADLLSLPGLVGTGLATLPRDPYLTPDPPRRARWGAELARVPGCRVAIHWRGEVPDRRSIPLGAFAPLAAVAGVRLISVQRGRGQADADRAPFPLLNPAPALDAGPDAFVDTAAVLAGVDLVVTNDGPIAHLAGALGRPVWVALPVGPDWRWMVDRPDSPWYPGMRLFRQRRQGDWSAVFSEIVRAARALTSLPTPPGALRAG